jgi:hypothetical protein
MSHRYPIIAKTIKTKAGSWYVSIWTSRQGNRGSRYTAYSYHAVERIGEAFGRELRGTGRLMDAKKAIERLAA